MEDFGLRLENLREKAGYTKKEMSELLGFTANVYGSYERGDRRPSLETVVKLADIFNVSLDYLLRGQEYKREDSLNKNIQEVVTLFQENGISKPYITEINKWRSLSKEDLKELTDHFNWVVYKAEKEYKRK